VEEKKLLSPKLEKEVRKGASQHLREKGGSFAQKKKKSTLLEKGKGFPDTGTGGGGPFQKGRTYATVEKVGKESSRGEKTGAGGEPFTPEDRGGKRVPLS